MSIYRPNPAYLRAERRPDGWYVMDQFGPIDGPYESSWDAWAAIGREERAYNEAGNSIIAGDPDYRAKAEGRS